MTTSRGRVRRYAVEEGWGIIDSDDTPGGCLIQALHNPDAFRNPRRW
ncbi:hypothetical protein [Rhodococcus sp. 06-235-1A]|nr:hypothetical protein [Rhodococcus sp. 06-235-1A]